MLIVSLAYDPAYDSWTRMEDMAARNEGCLPIVKMSRDVGSLPGLMLPLTFPKCHSQTRERKKEEKKGKRVGEEECSSLSRFRNPCNE